eukprot:6485293-Amphidinium_carterae.3
MGHCEYCGNLGIKAWHRLLAYCYGLVCGVLNRGAGEVAHRLAGARNIIIEGWLLKHTVWQARALSAACSCSSSSHIESNAFSSRRTLLVSIRTRGTPLVKWLLACKNKELLVEFPVLDVIMQAASAFAKVFNAEGPHQTLTEFLKKPNKQNKAQLATLMGAMSSALKDIAIEDEETKTAVSTWRASSEFETVTSLLKSKMETLKKTATDMMADALSTSMVEAKPWARGDENKSWKVKLTTDSPWEQIVATAEQALLKESTAKTVMQVSEKLEQVLWRVRKESGGQKHLAPSCQLEVAHEQCKVLESTKTLAEMLDMSVPSESCTKAKVMAAFCQVTMAEGLLIALCRKNSPMPKADMKRRLDSTWANLSSKRYDQDLKTLLHPTVEAKAMELSLSVPAKP